MYSKTCKYGLRAVIALARYTNEEERIGVTELAENIQVPSHFLAKILQELSRKNLISSIRGPGGGFFLTKENRNQNVLSVIVALDGWGWYDNCAFGLPECDEKHPCPMHHVYAPVKQNLYEDLRDNTIDEFADKLIAGEKKIQCQKMK